MGDERGHHYIEGAGSADLVGEMHAVVGLGVAGLGNRRSALSYPGPLALIGAITIVRSRDNGPGPLCQLNALALRSFEATSARDASHARTVMHRTEPTSC
jgi:hypothetical protein